MKKGKNQTPTKENAYVSYKALDSDSCAHTSIMFDGVQSHVDVQ